MIRRYRLFLRGLSTNWLGTAGVVLTTSSFILFVFMELLRIIGTVTNAYVGLISYMALPVLFIVGLILIPIGWYRFKKAAGKSMDDLLRDRFPEEMVRSRGLGSNFLKIASLLTLVNLLFLGLGGARMLHFMDQPEFCGTACHEVMNPEWVVYQNSPHAHVRCVDCHVGEGADALVDAKLNGLWQIISATFDLYEKPIPTPVHNLRPARETCEKCHWPDKFYGSRIKTIETYALDEASTPSYTTLALKVGSGTGRERGTIHWHIAERNEVRYQPVDEKRIAMAWVEVRKEDGYHRYANSKLSGRAAQRSDGSGELPPVRTVDCIDCHNRATHIYREPEAAVDEAIAAGRISRNPPGAKRIALGALIDRYAGGVMAEVAIDDAVRGYYLRDASDAAIERNDEIEQMVAVLQEIYSRNIHPEMNIGWNTYSSHIGHRGAGGCPRCHNPDMVDGDGRAIAHDCTLCHSILAYDSGEPFAFLKPPADDARDRKMHLYLQQEFIGSGK
jgi:hypothetical protein